MGHKPPNAIPKEEVLATGVHHLVKLLLKYIGAWRCHEEMEESRHRHTMELFLSLLEYYRSH